MGAGAHLVNVCTSSVPLLMDSEAEAEQRGGSGEQAEDEQARQWHAGLQRRGQHERRHDERVVHWSRRGRVRKARRYEAITDLLCELSWMSKL